MSVHAESATVAELTTIFRSVSTRRRQGILEIATEFDRYTVIFNLGKIVQIERKSESATSIICNRLVAVGAMEEQTRQTLQDLEVNLSELYSFLVGNKLVDAGQLRRAIEVYQIDLLHSLRLIEHAEFNFSPKVTHVEKEVALNISPGQLLLDLVEIEAEEERFLEYFGGFSPEECRIRAKTATKRLTAGPQSEVFNALKGERSLAELRERVLLTQFEFRQGLIGLIEADAIVLTSVGEGAVETPEDEPSAENFFEEEPVQEAGPEPVSLVEQSPPIQIVPEPESPQVFTAPEAKFSPDMSLSNLIAQVNLQFIDHEGIERIGLMMTAVFLALLAFVAPQLVQSFFTALSDFAGQF